MDFIPPHLYQPPRRLISAHEHNQTTLIVVQLMLCALLVLVAFVAWLFV